MCRHLAYLGPSIPLAEVLYGAPHSLAAQARAPKHQLWGDDNPDGFGVGWYERIGGDASGYRTTTPIWEDDAFASHAADTRAAVIVAAARLRSPGSPVEPAAVAPLEAEGWLCSLNGIVERFHDGVGDALRARLPASRKSAIRSRADTEICFQLLLERMASGESASAAVAALVTELESLTTGMFNFLLTDGRRLVASAVGNSLFVRSDPVVIASEPLDDDPVWRRVEDRSILVADTGAIRSLTLETAA